MPGDVDIAAIASLLADQTRVGMLLALGDGRALPAGELARCVHVSPSTASAHLTRLVESQLLTVEKQGRHHYFRLANPALMQVIESLAVFAPPRPIRSLRDSTIAEAVRSARMCYNHLAGELGVALSQALVEKQFLTSIHDGYIVTEEGKRWFLELGLDCVQKHEHFLVPHHIDWSERRYHVAGTLGAAIANRLFDLGWIKRIPSSRAVRITENGQKEFEKVLGLRENNNAF